MCLCLMGAEFDFADDGDRHLQLQPALASWPPHRPPIGLASGSSLTFPFVAYVPVMLRLCPEAGFFCSFLLQCIAPPTCLCIAAVSDSHSDQLLRTLHPNTSVPALYALFCSFCSLPSQCQVQDSLLRLCSEALFGAQRRVVLPLRGCFQAVLSGCTMLPIISCSSFALSKCLQMVVNMGGPGCTQGGMLVLYLFGVMSKNPRHFIQFQIVIYFGRPT